MGLNQQPRPGDACTSDIPSEHSTPFQTAERCQPEVRLHTTEEQLKWNASVEESGLSIYITLNAQGVVLTINPQGAALLGYSLEELIELPSFSWVHPQERARLQVGFKAVVQCPTQVMKGQFRLYLKDGSYLGVQLTAQALQGIDANPVFLFACERVTQLPSLKLNIHEGKSCACTLPTDAPKREIVEFFSQEAIRAGMAMGKKMTELKQAEASLSQLVQRERLIAGITQRIRQSLNLEEILNTTVAQVRQLLEADRVLVYRLAADGTGCVVTEAVVSGWPAVLGRTFPEEVFPQQSHRLYSQGRIYAVFDIEQAEVASCLVEFVKQFHVKAKLVVPILQGEELWGLLIAHQCSSPRQWQSFEIELLKQLAVQVAIAIQQSELFRQVKRLNADLERKARARTAQLQLAFDFEATLKRITDRVRDSLDEGQILQTAVQELGVVLGVKCCHAALYDLELGSSTICYEYTTSGTPSQGRVTQMLDLPELYAQLLEGQCFQFCSMFATPVHAQVAILVCPIFDDKGIIGDLWLINHKYSSFHEQDIRLVQQVANQCAIAIRQARLYQASQAQVQELEKLNRLKDDFLSTVSHELRTPVANIKMAIQMLEIVLKQAGILDTEPNKAARYFQILHDECQREINLINNLLDLSRLEAGTEPLMLIPIDPNIWIPSIAEPFIERAREQQQQLNIAIPSQLPTLTTDLSELERILSELLHNACKYTPPGGTITVSAQATATTLQLGVSNSGTEIPERELTHIFDKFYRIPNNDPWKHGGTGLGLALVKKLVEHLNGTIQAKSSAGQTTFTLEFPLSSLTV